MYCTGMYCTSQYYCKTEGFSASGCVPEPLRHNEWSFHPLWQLIRDNMHATPHLLVCSQSIVGANTSQ